MWDFSFISLSAWEHENQSIILTALIIHAEAKEVISSNPFLAHLGLGNGTQRIESWDKSDYWEV